MKDRRRRGKRPHQHVRPRLGAIVKTGQNHRNRAGLDHRHPVFVEGLGNGEGHAGLFVTVLVPLQVGGEEAVGGVPPLNLREGEALQGSPGEGGDRLVAAGGVVVDDVEADPLVSQDAGDLDVRSNLTITGADAATTIIDAQGIDRVLHVVGSVRLDVSGVTITGGSPPAMQHGGGIGNEGGSVTLADSSRRHTAARSSESNHRKSVQKVSASDGPTAMPNKMLTAVAQNNTPMEERIMNAAAPLRPVSEKPEVAKMEVM